MIFSMTLCQRSSFDPKKTNGGGLFDPSTNPNLILISSVECKSMENFAAVMIHELGHYAYYKKYGNNPPDHSNACEAEVQCFGYSISTTCKNQPKYAPYYKPAKGQP